MALTKAEWKEIAQAFLQSVPVSAPTQDKMDQVDCRYLPEYSTETLMRVAADIILTY